MEEIDKTVQFLVERAHVESNLFWIRTNIFLVIHSALFAFVIKMALTSTNLCDSQHTFLLIISVLGVFLALLWFLINIKSKQYNEKWFTNAQKIVYSSGLQEKYPAIAAHSECLKATDWMQFAVLIILSAWLIFFLWILIPKGIYNRSYWLLVGFAGMPVGYLICLLFTRPNRRNECGRNRKEKRDTMGVIMHPPS